METATQDTSSTDIVQVQLLFGRLESSVNLHNDALIRDLVASARLVWPTLPPEFKFVIRGRARKSDDDANMTLSQAGLSNKSRVLIVASSTAAVDTLLTTPKSRVRDDLHESGIGNLSLHNASSSTLARPRLQRQAEFGFGSFATLPGFDDGLRPDSTAALELLHRLADDPGIVSVMRAHKLRVGSLGEMYPDGKVGVDPVCVLGLNTNKGASITLRLRTDDLLGFRKYDVILKTLYHELAHNTLSEHTGDFYALVSTYEREGAAADWTRTTARTTGGATQVYRRPAVANSHKGNAASGGGTNISIDGPHVVGGSALPEGRTVREAAAAAAEARRSAAERPAETVPQSGSHTCDACVPEKSPWNV